MSQISESDRPLIDLLRAKSAMSISQLEESMGVTATAVRQRLNRLMALGLVIRNPSIAGRGRPVHLYSLTEKGLETLPNNLNDLALALWKEVQQISDDSTRQRILLGAVRRLAEKYENEVHGSTIAQRMEAITQLFADRQIPVTVAQEKGLPVIQITGCPYPTLAAEDREICELEEQLLSKIAGHPVKLRECQHDGSEYCSFRTAAQLEPPAIQTIQ